MTLPIFDVYIPENVKDALAFLWQNKDSARIIAGGTDIVPSLKQRLFEPKSLVDVKSLPELHGIHQLPDGGVRIGALTTISHIATSSLLRKDFPVLSGAAVTVAGPSLRNVGTIGGNICLDTRCYWYNQSYFWRSACGFCIKKDGDLCHVAPGSKQCWAVYSGDTAAALLTLDARIKLSSLQGDRIMALSDFFLNDGLIRNKLLPGELLTEIYLPGAMRGYAGCYEKFRIRGSVDYPLAGVAIALKRSNGIVEDLRIGLTALNPQPVLLDALHPLLVEENGIENIQKLTMKTAKPLKTSGSTIEYRRHMIGVMVKRGLERLGVR